MPIRTEELDRVESGRSENASEVGRAALRNAIEHGLASGIAEGDVFARIREKFNLPDTPASKPTPPENN